MTLGFRNAACSSAAGALLVLLACSGCSSECHDADGDGRGDGCEQGPDCDDGNRKLGARCDQLARTCAEHRSAEGCPCLGGAHHECYSGAPETQDVGMCRAGAQRCINEAWGACEGEVAPLRERCNGDDDDCDGVIDEGVRSPCGGCDPGCAGGVWGPPTVPFEPGDGLDLTTLGELTLARERVAHAFVWVPNTGEGTLSKVDATRAQELARYRIAGEPERIAVDHLGDAWVLSPALEGESQLTKVAGDPERCVDRNGDGLRTSSAPDDVLPLGEDDCVLWSVPVGEPGALARALAIDGTISPDEEIGGNGWVGLQHGERLLQVDARDGKVLRDIGTPGLAPFAAVFDPWGQLWVIDRGGILGRFDPRPAPPALELLLAPLRCYQFESLASDLDGALTITGFACEDVVTYDPPRSLWRHLLTEDVLDTRGVALLASDAWVTHTGGLLSRVRRDPLSIGSAFSLRTEDAAPLESTANSVDADGQLWIASSMGAGDDRGVLSRFDPTAQEVSAQVAVGRLPRVQGDLTGDRLFALQSAEASAEHVFLGCGGSGFGVDAGTVATGTTWKRVHLGWLAGSGASVLVEVRRADQVGELDDQPYVTLGSLPEQEPPYDLDLPDGGALQVRLTLRARARIGAPRIARVGVEWVCPGPQ